MFAGHYSAAFAAKGLAPGVPLWVLLLAVQLVDVAWALLVLAGVEQVRIDPSLPSNALDLHHMPYTHGLLATGVWVGGTWIVARRSLGGGRLAAVVAGAVGSHWLLDFLVHRPDLPLVFGPPKLGLALWNRPALALGLEVGLLIAGAAFCLRRGAPFSRRGLPLVGLVATLLAAQGVLLLGGTPHSVTGVVVTALVFFLFVAWLGAVAERRARVIA